MADSINIQDYYNLRGTQAQGAADRWLNAVREDAQQKLGKMDPGMRRRVSQQLDRWVAGRYENLLVHEKREVRSGKIAELNTRMAEGAASTASDLIAAARSESRSIAERRDALMATPESDERAKALSDLDDERSEGNTRRIMQLAAETAGREIEWDNAVQEGLFSPEEAKARAMANRRDTYKMAIEALQTGDEPDAADAIIAALEDEGGDTDQKTGKRAKGHLAKTCGFTPLDIAGFKEGSKRARMRIDAERKRREAEAKEAARDAAREKEIKLHLQSVPQDAEGQAAYYERMGADYAELANDPSLDSATRLQYAKTAASLGFRAAGERDAIQRSKKAEERERKAEAKEAARELKAAVKEQQEQNFAVAENDFNAGGYFADDGEWRDYDAASMAEQARTMLINGQISRTQFSRLMTMQKRELDGENLEFRDLALAEAKKLIPNIAYKGGRFRFKPSAKVGVNDKAMEAETGSRWYWSNPTEEISYGQLVRAMNLTLDWAQHHHASIEEMKKHFDELTTETKNNIRRRSIEERLQEEQDTINDFRRLENAYNIGR